MIHIAMTTRTKYRRGLEKEPNTVYIGRAWGPFKKASKWGNPFKIGKDGNIEEVLAKYEGYVIESDLYNELPELAGKTLICWCDTDKPCHADVLIKLIPIAQWHPDESA